MNNLIDITGKKYGRLTVIERAESHIAPSGQRRTRWLCKCDCGNKIIAAGANLKNGSIKSCGCLKSENITRKNKANKKYNIYDLSGEYGIGYTTKGEEFYFDLDDYDKIKNHCWSISTANGYVMARIMKGKKKTTLLMHRLIMDFPDGSKFKVDHIHGCNTRNDNRKSNLRIVTNSQNGMNIKLRSNNKSGVTGVSWHSSRKKWCASIHIDGKTKHLGEYDSFDSAVIARKNAEEKYFGEYSYDNSQKKEVV